MIKVFLADRPRHSPLCLMCDHWCWGCCWPGHWTGWTCQGLSPPPLPGLSWLLPCSVLRHHKTSRLTESLSTNQQPEFSRLDQSETWHRPLVSRPWWWPAWLSGLKVPHWWLICPLDRQTPAPLSLSRQLYSKEIFVTKYFPNHGDRQVESVYLNSTHWLWILASFYLCLSFMYQIRKRFSF